MGKQSGSLLQQMGRRWAHKQSIHKGTGNFREQRKRKDLPSDQYSHLFSQIEHDLRTQFLSHFMSLEVSPPLFYILNNYLLYYSF